MKTDLVAQKVVLAFLIFFVWVHSTPASAGYDYFGRFIPQGTPTIDGVLSSGEWDDLGQVTLYKFFGEDAKVDLYFMWDGDYLYLGAQVEDFELWVDDINPGSEWTSTWDDDALKWEIDPDASADEYLQPDDRVLAVNATSTAVRFDRGDGGGGTQGIWIDPAGDSVKTAATIDGTLNDVTFKTRTSEAQKDSGFSVEMAIRWTALFDNGQLPTLADGYTLAMNVTHIEDDTGGPLDPEYDEAWKRVADELTRFMGEEDHPENWARFVLSARQDRNAPAPIGGLVAVNPGPFSTMLSFTATGDNGSTGIAKDYDIRYATSPITEANWTSATVYANNTRPRQAGQAETIKIIGLTPQTTYTIGVKAKDENGNASALTTTSFTTGAVSGIDDKGYLTTDPGGRYLAWENGEPFIVIGDNQGLSWPHIRTFYDGLMWNDDLANLQELSTMGYRRHRRWPQLSQDAERSWGQHPSHHGRKPGTDPSGLFLR